MWPLTLQADAQQLLRHVEAVHAVVGAAVARHLVLVLQGL
jgi:hypothetical protein